MKISIANINKALILCELYNKSKPLGLGLIHFTPNNMTVSEAQSIIDNQGLKFDYLKGRVMKVNLSEDEVDSWVMIEIMEMVLCRKLYHQLKLNIKVI